MDGWRVHLNTSGGDPVLWGATFLAHIKPGWGWVINRGSKTLLGQENWTTWIKKEIFMFSSDQPDPVLAVQCAPYDLCSAMQKTFSHRKISTNLCTFFIWRTVTNIWSLFSCFWLTTCSVSVLMILLQSWKRESFPVIMHYASIAYNCEVCILKGQSKSNHIEKYLELYCVQT